MIQRSGLLYFLGTLLSVIVWCSWLCVQNMCALVSMRQKMIYSFCEFIKCNLSCQDNILYKKEDSDVYCSLLWFLLNTCICIFKWRDSKLSCIEQTIYFAGLNEKRLLKIHAVRFNPQNTDGLFDHYFLFKSYEFKRIY